MKPTVGEQLRSARESRGLTLEDAVKATHIRRAYLQELENDRPEALHSDVQARGYLRLYASYLGIPASPLIAAWDQPDQPAEESADTTPETPPQEIFSAAPEGGEAPLEPTADALEADEAKEGDTSTGTDQGGLEQTTGQTVKDWTASLRDVLRRIPKLSEFLPKRGVAQAQPAKKHRQAARDQIEKEKAELQANPIRPSDEIQADIGNALRERREALELTLSDAETFTNVKRMYLEMMEAGDFGQMPSSVQGRGMLKHYVQFLGMDESWIMDAYAESLQALRMEKETQKQRKPQPPLTVQLHIPEKWRQILNPDLILGGAFIIALFTFIIWGGAQVFSAAEPTATEAPSISEMLMQSPTISPTAVEGTPEDDEPIPQVTAIPGVEVAETTPVPTATVNPAPLQLYIIASDRAFLRVEVDGEQVFNGRVEPEDVFTFSGEEQITLLTGNGAALEVYFNQEYLGDLGRVGEVANLRFSLDGLSTATPQPSATAQPAAEALPDAAGGN